MDEKKIYQIFDQIGKDNMPETLDVLPAIQKTLNKRKGQSQMRWYMTYSRQVASVLIGLLFMVGAVYAITQRTIHDPVLDESMITMIDQSQTIDNRTVYLEWAYADANRISLSYWMMDDDGIDDPLEVIHISLTDDKQNFYQHTSAIVPYIEDGVLKAIAHYSAAVIDGEPETLNLSLTVWNDFTFDFEVPFIKAYHIDRQPDIDVNGISLNLDWAIITPSMTRLSVCYDVPDEQFWMPHIHLKFNGQAVGEDDNYSDMNRSRMRQDDRMCYGYNFLTGYEQLPENITIEVERLSTAHYYGEEAMLQLADILRSQGIEAIVTPYEHGIDGSYTLQVVDPLDSAKLTSALWEEAMNKMDIPPISGEKIEGPWVIEIEIP